jgi:hypothetical protein
MGAAGGHTDLLTTWSLGRYVVWAALVAAATGLTTVGVAGTFLRAGAARRPSARVAMALGVAATVLLVPGAWAVTAVMALFGVALVVASERLRGPGERFVGPIRLLGVAWPVGITVLLLGNEVFRVGPVDEYGDYPLAWFVPFVTCAACSAAALFTIGRQLRAERPADLTARTLTPATPLGA